MSATSKPQSNPGAGAEVSITVPANKWWRLRTVHFKLVTAVAVANRLVKLVLDDGSVSFFKSPNDVNHVASQTSEYSYALALTQEGAQSATGLARTYPLPDVILYPGCRILTVTGGIQGADQFSEVNLLVDEFGTDPTVIRMQNGQVLN